jgi:hypothetical protein
MTDHTDNNEQPRDHMVDTTESLLYGDPDTAAENLRKSMTTEFDRLHTHRANQARLNAAQARSRAELQQFQEENPEFVANEAAVAAGERLCYLEQVKDLQKAGLYDRAKFREQNGRDPTHGEIGNHHLFARANGLDVRSVKDLLDSSAGQVEEQMPGVRRRIKDIDKNRANAVRDRMKLSAASHGVDLDRYATDWQPQSRQPNLDAGGPATSQTIQASDRRDAGEGGDDLTPSRKAAFDKFFAGRGQGTDRRPGAGRTDNVRVNRNADDGRYPDRRAAEAAG